MFTVTIPIYAILQITALLIALRLVYKASREYKVTVHTDLPRQGEEFRLRRLGLRASLYLLLHFWKVRPLAYTSLQIWVVGDHYLLVTFDHRLYPAAKRPIIQRHNCLIHLSHVEHELGLGANVLKQPVHGYAFQIYFGLSEGYEALAELKKRTNNPTLNLAQSWG